MYFNAETGQVGILTPAIDRLTLLIEKHLESRENLHTDHFMISLIEAFKELKMIIQNKEDIENGTRHVY